MKFGLFDHVDVNDRPLTQQLDERIEFVSTAEKAGFYSYHVAEHHATPLNMLKDAGFGGYFSVEVIHAPGSGHDADGVLANYAKVFRSY